MKIRKVITLVCTAIVSVVVNSQTTFNQVDENGKKNGLWKGYHPESKRLRYEGNFEHGVEVGMFTYYDDTKVQSVIATREFNPKDRSAYTIFYNQSKNIVSEGKMVDKLHHGLWKYYHENSKILMCTEHYLNGKLEGKRVVYYPNGKIAEETNYVNGVRNGSYKKYTLEGVLLEESTYKNGQFDGKAIYRDTENNVVSQGIYVDGKKTGIWQFFEKGKLLREENMSKVKKLVKPKSK